MSNGKSKGLAGKITAITAVLVALTALFAVAGPFYDQTRTLICRVAPSLCNNGEDEKCSPELPLSEYLACSRES